MFAEGLEDLDAAGIELRLAGVKGPVRDAMERTGFVRALGEDRFHMDVDAAVAHARSTGRPSPPTDSRVAALAGAAEST